MSWIRNTVASYYDFFPPWCRSNSSVRHQVSPEADGSEMESFMSNGRPLAAGGAAGSCRGHLDPALTSDTWAEKFESLERINSICETNSFDSCKSCNGWFPAVYMTYTSQNLRLFHGSNLSVLNFRIFCLCIRGQWVGGRRAATCVRAAPLPGYRGQLTRNGEDREEMDGNKRKLDQSSRKAVLALWICGAEREWEETLSTTSILGYSVTVFFLHWCSICKYLRRVNMWSRATKGQGHQVRYQFPYGVTQPITVCLCLAPRTMALEVIFLHKVILLYSYSFSVSPFLKQVPQFYNYIWVH